MPRIPTKLADLEAREKELSLELVQKKNEVLLFKKNNPALFKLEGRIEILNKILLLSGLFLGYLIYDWSFFRHEDILRSIVYIIGYLFMSMGLGVMLTATLIYLFELDNLVAKFSGVRRLDFLDFKRKRKTQKYSMFMIEQDLGVVRLRIKKIHKGKRKS